MSTPSLNNTAWGKEALKELLLNAIAQSDDLYTQLNALRDTFNQYVSNYDLYLEDVWNENVDGETHFEYILRSLDTLNETERLAWDVYLNHQDAKGVWHLDDYQHSVIRLPSLKATIDDIIQFIDANTLPVMLPPCSMNIVDL